MNEALRELLVHLRGMWNRRFVGLAVAWIAGIVAVGIALIVPENYAASARAYVDTQSMLRPVMAGLSIQPSLDQQVALISRTLLSRPNIEKLVQIAKLDDEVVSQADREALIEHLTKRIELTGNATSNIYVISYRDSNPQRALAVIEALLGIFVQSSVGDERQDARGALRFLDEQISHYEKNLEVAESRLKDFRLKYLGVPGQSGQAGQDYFGRMSRLTDEITNAKLELRAAIESRDSYRRDLAGQAPTMPATGRGGNAGTPVPEIDARIAAQKTKLDELLRTYTDQHPDVAGTRRVIAELEVQQRQERQARELASAKSGKPLEPSESNPVYEKIRVALSDAEAKVASLQGRIAAYESEYAQLKIQARLVPQVEAELAQLNRDYDIQKKTYTDLLARREAATMGVKVQDTEGAPFRVVDPPRVSPKPVQPTRPVMLVIAFVFALGIGILATFVANEVVPTIQDLRSLATFTERPALGSISMVIDESTRLRQRRGFLMFFGGLGGLLTAFGAVLAIALMSARVA
jgi:polysaccharide chain length determinant protein (PEP-CTERM system associated)